MEEDEDFEEGEEDNDENSLSPQHYELYKKGIPLEVIKQGSSAIRSYAEANNIDVTKSKSNK